MPGLPHATGSRAAEQLGSSAGQRYAPEGTAEATPLSACCTLTLAQAVVELGRLQELLPPVRVLPLSLPQMVLHTGKTPPDSIQREPRGEAHE